MIVVFGDSKYKKLTHRFFGRDIVSEHFICICYFTNQYEGEMITYEVDAKKKKHIQKLEMDERIIRVNRIANERNSIRVNGKRYQLR